MIKYSLHENKGMYCVSFRITDKNGKKIQKQLSTGVKCIRGNKREAEAKAREIVEKFEGITGVTRCELLCDYVSDWIERDRSRIQSTTYDGYMHMLNKHIYPYFKNTRLKLIDVLPMHIERYCTDKIDSGLSPNTVIKHLAVIRTALYDAMKNGIIKNNPADLAERPKRATPKHSFYDVEELKKLFKISENTNIEVPIRLAVIFGLRRSETLGLRWSAIDFDNGIMYVNEKVVRKNDNGKIIDIASNEMKTESSEREYLLNDYVLNYLKEVKEKQNQLIRRSNEYVDCVCVNEIGERLKSDYVTHSFKKLLIKHDMKHIKFHELRHSCGTTLKDSGAPMKDIQGYLGHADYRTTANIYTHTDLNRKKELLDIMTGLFE